MARLPLEIGEWGNINRVKGSTPPEANCWFRDARGVRVRVSRSGTSFADAERRLKKALVSMQSAAVGELEITRESTIGELADIYFDELEESGQKDGTITNYRSRYDNHIAPELANVKLRQATVGRLGQVIRAHKDRPSTAKAIRVVLINMFALAVRHDAIKINLAANTKPVKVESGKVVALNPEKVQSMLRLFELHDKVNGGDMYDSLLLLASTGTRTGELLAFDWDEISFAKDGTAVARVTGTLVEDSKTGKLKKQPTPKSKSSERGLTLPPTAATRMKQRWEKSEGDYVFPSRNGSYMWPNNYRRSWRKITDATEFEGITPKAFRKAVATYLDRAVGRTAAKEQLGHESEDITTRYYIEMEESVANFADHLEGLVGN